MIHIVSEGISRWLEKEGAISSERHALFAYATYSLIFGMLPVLIISFWGIVFGMLQEGLIMLIPFMAIRKFSGGLHMKSAKQCIFFSTILLLAALGMVRVFICVNQYTTLTFLVVISVLCICTFSPLDNAARPLAPMEKRTFKIIARFISVIAMVLYIILQDAKLIGVAVPVGVGIFITALLQLPCVIRRMVRTTIPANQNCTENVITSNSDCKNHFN